MPLSGADFSAIRSAAVQSDATVVLSARSASGLVIEEGKKVAESNRVLRPLADFAVRRFSPAGSSKAGSHQSAFQHLFEAIVLSGKEAVYRSVVEGLQNLGFPGDTAATAEALLPVGIPKVTKQEFCSLSIQRWWLFAPRTRRELLNGLKCELCTFLEQT